MGLGFRFGFFRSIMRLSLEPFQCSGFGAVEIGDLWFGVMNWEAAQKKTLKPSTSKPSIEIHNEQLDRESFLIGPCRHSYIGCLKQRTSHRSKENQVIQIYRQPGTNFMVSPPPLKSFETPAIWFRRPYTRNQTKPRLEAKPSITLYARSN